jgi:hypothetical protein
MADAPGGDTIADKAMTKKKAAGVENRRMGNQPPAGRINSRRNDVVDDIALASFNSKAAFLSAGQAMRDGRASTPFPAVSAGRNSATASGFLFATHRPLPPHGG